MKLASDLVDAEFLRSPKRQISRAASVPWERIMGRKVAYWSQRV